MSAVVARLVAEGLVPGPNMLTTESPPTAYALSVADLVGADQTAAANGSGAHGGDLVPGADASQVGAAIYVRIRGLPYQATETDVVGFFEGK